MKRRILRAAWCVLGSIISGWAAATSLAVVDSSGSARGLPDESDRVPSLAEVRAAYQPSDVRLLDRNGVVLHELRVDTSRRRLQWTPLAEVSPALQAAVIASEDRRFYQHGGVDALALLAAAARRLTGARPRGASTISMQVAALVGCHAAPHNRPRTWSEKWQQMRLAWVLEQRWSKAEILEAYLNLVSFRGELQGVAAAANGLFGKAPHGLSAAESLVLAVLLRSPNAPPDAVRRRADHLRQVLAQQSPETADTADVASALTGALDASPQVGARADLAPHVARRLLRTTPPYRPVRSTLDADTQRLASMILRQQLLALREQHVHDGAVLVVDNASGDVLAYVGASGTLSAAPHVDGVRALRQAGSAMKPFLYAFAIEQRLLTPASLIEDRPLELPVTGGLYRPRNYDEVFRGLVTVRTALSSSLNIPAVRTLGLVGTDAFVQHLRRLGFASLVESGDYYGPSLALGSGDVSLWNLVNAYRALANGGVWSPLRLAANETAAAPPERVYSQGTAFIVSDVLADRESRSVTFGLESPLGTRFWSAVKTGTSKDMRDNWCVGYSQRYTVGVWVGNFSGRPMHDVSGVSGAAPAWLEIMNWLHREQPSAAPPAPDGVVARAISRPERPEAARLEWFLAGTEPTQAHIELAGSRPHITDPVAGTVVALDPDIPRAQQRMRFDADGRGTETRWVLDGHDVGRTADVVFWAPQSGRHKLQLVDADGRCLDAAEFLVKGQVPP